MAISFELELPPADGEVDISRADLTFSGLDHSGPSYEVLVYFNAPDAGPDTARTESAGYAGRFAVFGHGGCFGADGHCDVTEPVSPFDRTHPHQLVPASRSLEVTPAIKALVAAGGTSVQVSLVPIVRSSALASPDQAADVLVLDQVALHTYE
jgi:tyrosinase